MFIDIFGFMHVKDGKSWSLPGGKGSDGNMKGCCLIKQKDVAYNPDANKPKGYNGW
ncbi:MAG: hypothetical protein LBH55_01545 [Mycoplasmataceae bacterium]|jgi:hypothetical protein|nr:hypothetical protein [Mycoplasmataceae bacterium]